MGRSGNSSGGSSSIVVETVQQGTTMMENSVGSGPLVTK